MEQYKEKLKVNCRITALCALLLALVSVLGFLAEAGIVPLTPLAGDEHWQSQWRGFMSGAAMGVLGFMVVGLLRARKALKDEKALRQLYIKENDERQIQIWTSARASAMQAFLLLGLVATVVAGYFSVPIAMTILACVLLNSLLGFGFKLYYSGKY